MKKISILVLFAVVMLSGCTGYSIVSQQPEQPIEIDGNSGDWNGKLKFIKEEKMAIGVMTDENNFYFALVTADRSTILKILRFGLTVWLEPGNEKGETIGIQYPIKSSLENRLHPIREPRAKGNKNFIKKLLQKIKETQSEFLVIRDDNFPLGAYELKNNTGSELAVGYNQGKLVYEIKIPKKRRNYFPVDLTALADDELNIRINSEVPVSLGMNKKPLQGGMDGMGRHGKNRRGMNMPGMNSPIDFEITVKLTGW